MNWKIAVWGAWLAVMVLLGTAVIRDGLRARKALKMRTEEYNIHVMTEEEEQAYELLTAPRPQIPHRCTI